MENNHSIYFKSVKGQDASSILKKFVSLVIRCQRKLDILMFEIDILSDCVVCREEKREKEFPFRIGLTSS